MKDSIIELIALSSIFLGLILGFVLVFDYSPVDAFFLEEDDDVAYLEGTVLRISYKESAEGNNKNDETADTSTTITVYGCRTFTAYASFPVDKNKEDNITLRGSFSDGLFIVEEYK